MNNDTSTITIERSEYDALNTRLAKMELLIQYYESQLLSAKRRQFGTSSERTEIDPQQLKLFEDSVAALPEVETEDITYKRKKQKGKRESDLAGMPVERIDYELSDTARKCPDCGESMQDIGIDIRRELKLVPAKVVVVEHAAHAYACRSCEETSDRTPIAKAVTPPALISGSLASPSLVAHIATQKYSNGLPLYRIEKGFKYDGVNISRQTMSNWVIKCSELYLEPVYERLKQYLLNETVLHADETTVQVLHEQGRDAQTKSYEWIYRTGERAERSIAIYEYRETRNREHPGNFLKDFQGFLHTDGYQVYHNLPPEITVVGCWAHVRRKWEEILKKLPKDKRKGSNAETGVAYINALFKLEREFSELTAAERHQKRLEKSKPVSDAFFAWVENLTDDALPKSPLGEAVHYSLKQRKYLENVFLDGRTDISNNRAERAVKPFVMGRKAWLFSNTPAGAKASSVMYSILETAKDNGLHPHRYLEFLLDALPNATTSDLDALLPWSDTLPELCRVPRSSDTAGTCK
jgi:Transposase and inactivated derivatives